MVFDIHASLSGWGYPSPFNYGCGKYGDKSDISMKMQTNEFYSSPSCKDSSLDPRKLQLTGSWKWFLCDYYLKDISTKMRLNELPSSLSCGNIYIDQQNRKLNVKWKWFSCERSQTCIHIDNRCDLHPHPDCLYEYKGVWIAEDEEDCIDEYKRKNLVQRSANLKCPSAMHNSKTAPIKAAILDDLNFKNTSQG